jgi:hypothetical protein
MTNKKLTSIAVYHFKRMRTTATFLHIFDVKKEGEYYVFHALFQGKTRIISKKITMDKEGNVIKLK